MKIEKHISAANKAFVKNHSIASLQSAYIANGMCTVGDLNVQYSFPIKIKGQGCIDWMDLRAALKAGLTHGDIIIKEGEVVGVAKLYLNTTLIELEAQTHTDYPLITLGELEKPRAFPCNLLITALKFATPFDKDIGMVPLNGVNLSEARVTGCNGAVIYQRETHQPNIELTLDPKAVAMLQPCGHVTIEVEKMEVDEDVAILKEMVADMKQVGETSFEVTLKDTPEETEDDDSGLIEKEIHEPKWVGPRHSVLKVEDAVIVARNIDNRYPNAAAVFFLPHEEVSLNRRMMNAALERLAPILNDTSTVKLTIQGYKAKLSAESESPDKYAEVDLGEVITIGDFEREFRAENLALAMSTDRDEFLLAWSLIREKPVYVNGNLLYAMWESVDDEE